MDDDEIIKIWHEKCIVGDRHPNQYNIAVIRFYRIIDEQARASALKELVTCLFWGQLTLDQQQAIYAAIKKTSECVEESNLSSARADDAPEKPILKSMRKWKERMNEKAAKARGLFNEPEKPEEECAKYGKLALALRLVEKLAKPKPEKQLMEEMDAASTSIAPELPPWERKPKKPKKVKP